MSDKFYADLQKAQDWVVSTWQQFSTWWEGLPDHARYAIAGTTLFILILLNIILSLRRKLKVNKTFSTAAIAATSKLQDEVQELQEEIDDLKEEEKYRNRADQHEWEGHQAQGSPPVPIGHLTATVHRFLQAQNENHALVKEAIEKLTTTAMSMHKESMGTLDMAIRRLTKRDDEDEDDED